MYTGEYKMCTVRYNINFMRKIFFLLFIFIAINISAQNDFRFKFNAGSIGAGINIFHNRESNGSEVFTDAINSGIEHCKTGIGLENTLTKYWAWNSIHDNNDDIAATRWSVLNFKLYWNFFDFDIFPKRRMNYYFGLFTGINYIFIDDDTFKWNEYVYSAGLHIGLVMHLNKYILYNIFEAEGGYRLMNGYNTFYVTFKVDFITILTIYLYSKATEKK